jgi:hypothetical protein
MTAEQVSSMAHAIAAKHYLLDCMRELLFESVREEMFPHLPSRSQCLFLVENGVDIKASAKRYGFDEPMRTVVEIEALEGSIIFRGQASLLNTGPIIGDILAAAKQYWSGAPPEMPLDDVEILLCGPFRILGVRQLGDGAAVFIDGKGFAELFRGDCHAQSRSTAN